MKAEKSRYLKQSRATYRAESSAPGHEASILFMLIIKPLSMRRLWRRESPRFSKHLNKANDEINWKACKSNNQKSLERNHSTQRKTSTQQSCGLTSRRRHAALTGPKPPPVGVSSLVWGRIGHWSMGVCEVERLHSSPSTWLRRTNYKPKNQTQNLVFPYESRSPSMSQDATTGFMQGKNSLPLWLVRYGRHVSLTWPACIN